MRRCRRPKSSRFGMSSCREPSGSRGAHDAAWVAPGFEGIAVKPVGMRAPNQNGYAAFYTSCNGFGLIASTHYRSDSFGDLMVK